MSTQPLNTALYSSAFNHFYISQHTLTLPVIISVFFIFFYFFSSFLLNVILLRSIFSGDLISSYAAFAGCWTYPRMCTNTWPSSIELDIEKHIFSYVETPIVTDHAHTDWLQTHSAGTSHTLTVHEIFGKFSLISFKIFFIFRPVIPKWFGAMLHLNMGPISISFY